MTIPDEAITAAIRNGWDYIGIDAVEEYVNMSRTRLDGEVA